MATFSATNEKIEAMRWENQDIADVRDVNNQNRLLLRRFYEVLGAMGYVPGAPSAGGSVPAVRTIGGALVPGTVGTADVTVAPGVFLFVPSADPGQPDPNIFAHVVDSAVAVGSASDNLAGGDTRIDLLTVKVDRDILNAADQETRKGRTPANVIVQVTPHKRVRTRATFSYYEGTPGAGDPATPADEVVIARYTMLDATSVFSSVENLLTATGWLPRSLPGADALMIVTPTGEVEYQTYDDFVDQYGEFHGYRWEPLEPFHAAHVVSGIANYSSNTWVLEANAQIIFRLPLVDGHKLRYLRIYGVDTADNLIRVGLIHQLADLSGTATVGTDQDSSGTGLQYVTRDFGAGTEYQLNVPAVSGSFALLSLTNVPVAAGTDSVTIYRAQMYVALVADIG